MTPSISIDTAVLQINCLVLIQQCHCVSCYFPRLWGTGISAAVLTFGLHFCIFRKTENGVKTMKFSMTDYKTRELETLLIILECI